MLGRRSQKNKSSRGSLGGCKSMCRFYWHRPLGAAEDCRRLTVQQEADKTTPWALPLSFDSLLEEIRKDPRRLETVEFDGNVDAWKKLAMNDSEWPGIYQRILQRRPVKIVFFGGSSDDQRSKLLSKASCVRVVEIYDSSCHDKTLGMLQKTCSKLAELKMFHCADLSVTNADIILEMIGRKPSAFRSLVLSNTGFTEPRLTSRKLFLVSEESTLDEVVYEPIEQDAKDYLSVITKIHRMRHYYYARRKATDLSAYSVADDALGIVQSWWRSTHRPQFDQHAPEVNSMLKLSDWPLSRKSSGASTGSC